MTRRKGMELESLLDVVLGIGGTCADFEVAGLNKR